MSTVQCWNSEQVSVCMHSKCIPYTFNSDLLIAAGGTESSLFTAEMFTMYQK